jgi:hypothetical protein
MPARNVKPIFAITGGLNFSQPGGIVVDLENPLVQIPYLRRANNILFEDGGAVRKVGGALAATTLVGPLDDNPALAPVLAILPSAIGPIDFWAVRGGADATAAPYRGLSGWSLDSSIFNSIANPLSVGIGSSLQLGEDAGYTTWTISEFEGYSIIAAGTNAVDPVLLKYDSGLGTYPLTAWDPAEPNFSMSTVYKNRLWVAGDADNPSRLYYSDLNDPTAGYAAQFIDVDPDDGSNITALHVYKETLFIFKGTRKGSIHRLSGSTPSTFALTPFSKTIGCAGPNAVVDFGDDVLFADTDGNLRTLVTTQNYGDFKTSVITDPIHDYLADLIPVTELKHIHMSADVDQARVWVQLPTGPSQDNRISLVVDYREGVKLSTVNLVPASYVVPVRAGSADEDKKLIACTTAQIFSVDERGDERVENLVTTQAGSFSKLSAAYAAEIETPTINFVPAFSHNNLSKLSVSVEQVQRSSVGVVATDCAPFDPNISFTFKWQRDLMPLESTTLNHTFTSRLGSECAGETLPTDGTAFVLNASRLGGTKTAEVYAELETSDFRRISFQFEQGGLNEGLHIHSWSVVIGQDDTGSTENF